MPTYVVEEMEFTNQLKKYVRSLHANKNRQKYNKFIAEGPKICEEFLSAGKYKIELLFYTAEYQNEYPQLISSISTEKAYLIKEKELAQISCLKTANKVLLVLESNMSDSPEFNDFNWSLYLDKIQDPGNMGTLIRIADWYGLSTVFASEDSVDFYNPKVIQASMGAHNRVNLNVLTPDEFIELDRPKYGLVLNGKDIASLTKPAPGLIVIGNESKGIRPDIQASCTELITIARIGKAESLNASVACGIACHLLLFSSQT